MEYSVLGLWRFDPVGVAWKSLFSLKDSGKKTLKIKGKEIPTLDRFLDREFSRGLYYIVIRTADLIDGYYIVADANPGVAAMPVRGPVAARLKSMLRPLPAPSSMRLAGL